MHLPFTIKNFIMRKTIGYIMPTCQVNKQIYLGKDDLCKRYAQD